MSTEKILQKYITFFEKRAHKKIEGASLVPQNDPTTLFTSSGMQPLVPYLLGQIHPAGKRLVNVQNSFRAQDIDEIGDNRHTTFFRMLGNWSLGDYFKSEQLMWFFEFLIDPKEGLGLDPHKLYVTIFAGNSDIPKDEESIEIWKSLFQTVGIHAEVGEPSEVFRGKRIFAYGTDKNWWSRSGPPDTMPVGEPGGVDSEVFYDFEAESEGSDRLLEKRGGIHENSPFKNQPCHVNCDCGRFVEIGNSVFMQYRKTETGFEKLKQQNVDFGGGLERLAMASEDRQDLFETSLFKPIIKRLEEITGTSYKNAASEMRIITDHMIAAMFIATDGVKPSNKEQGYILRRFIRRGLDNFYKIHGKSIEPLILTIAESYKVTNPLIISNFAQTKMILLEEEMKYSRTRTDAAKFIEKELSSAKKMGDEVMMDYRQISPELAFKALSSYGLSPTQLESLGYRFDRQKLAEKIKEHQVVSRAGVEKKFRGGLADTHELTIMGHTATHLLHQALRDVLGDNVYQTGSNITTQRVRFDFNFDRKLTTEELKKVESIVNEKINMNLPVHFEMMSIEQARKVGAIGLFNEKYGDTVKIYFIGGGSKEDRGDAYSVEFCGGPHVDFTAHIKRFTITREESLGKNTRRLYALVG